MARRLALLLLPALLLAGCMGGGGDGDDTSSSSSPTTAAPATGSATAVEITSSPATAAAGSKATVCFTVSGSGRVAHVAIHWDNVTHAAEANRTFQSYDLGASYPNNRTSADPNGYTLQPTGARFCTAATMPSSGPVFVVAHVLDKDGVPGDLSTERRIEGTAAASPSIRIQNFAYNPPALSVTSGVTVAVQNADSVQHTLTSDAAAFDTGTMAGGQSDSFVAPAEPGTYAYHCNIHPSMKGTLTVTA